MRDAIIYNQETRIIGARIQGEVLAEHAKKGRG